MRTYETPVLTKREALVEITAQWSKKDPDPEPTPTPTPVNPFISPFFVP